MANNISFYLDRDTGDYVTIALWWYGDDPIYAEGGATKQSGSPAADSGNTTEWGLNNQMRDIGDSLVDLDARILAIIAGSAFSGRLQIGAGAWDYDVDPPEYSRITGTNGKLPVIWFDQTTEEFAHKVIKVPDNINVAGDLKIRYTGLARTWVTGKYVQLKFYHVAKGDTEVWDAIYVGIDSGDMALNVVSQKALDELVVTIPMATLGWTKNELVRTKHSRIANFSADVLTGDYGIAMAELEFPTI